MTSEDEKRLADEIEKVNAAYDDEVPLHEVLKRYAAIHKKIESLLERRGPALFEFMERVRFYPIDISGGDRLAALLMKAQEKNLIVVGLCFLLFGLVSPFVGYLEGNFVNPSLAIDAFHDTGYWIQFVVALPTVILLSGMYFGRLSLTLLSLMAANVFPISIKEWQEFREYAENIYRHKLAVILPYVVALGMLTLQGSEFGISRTNTWYFISLDSRSTIAGWFHIPLSFMLYYLVGLVVTRLIATFVVLRKFFKFPANVQPLHPDGCGGLQPLGALSMSINVAVFIFGIVIVFGYQSLIEDYQFSLSHPYIWLMFIAYVSAAAVLFFLPLYAAHNRMKEAKYNTLAVINERFGHINNDLIDDLAQGNKVDSSKLEELEALRTVHSIAARMPVYPFNLTTVSSFLGSVFAPLLLFVLQEIIDILLMLNY